VPAAGKGTYLDVPAQRQSSVLQQERLKLGTTNVEISSIARRGLADVREITSKRLASLFRSMDQTGVAL